MTGENLLLIIQILYIVIAVGTMFIVILENRNPVKTIAWVLVLLFLPLVGIIFYYYFGRDTRQKRLISSKTYNKIYKVATRKLKITTQDSYPEKFNGLIKSLSSSSHLYSGTKVRFIHSGVEMFDDLFDEINKAKHHIHIEYYIFMDDKLGTKLSNLLIQKAEEGIEVRILFDDVGSWKVKRNFFDNLNKKGVKTCAFLPSKFRWVAGRVNYRNHKKIIIIDGEVGYMGGMNIADRYVEGVKFGIWRDSQIKIRGYGVAGLQTSFLLDWHSMTGQILAEDIYYPYLQPEGNSLIQIVNGSPFGTDKWIHVGILNAIHLAKHSIYIQTPYFVPTDGLLQSLQLAARKGVEVKLMIPKKSDTYLVHITTKSFLEDIMRYGVGVYFFNGGFLHSKMLIIDNELTITGSVNMDVRSFEHNFEIEAFIYDEQTNDEARKIFAKDLESCTKVDPKLWKKRGVRGKIIGSFTRLFSPLL